MKLIRFASAAILLIVALIVPSFSITKTVEPNPKPAAFVDVYCLKSSQVASARLTVNLATGEYDYENCTTMLAISGDGKPFIGNDPDIADNRGIFHIKDNRTVVVKVDEGDLESRGRFIHDSSGTNVFFDQGAAGACTCP